MIQDRFLHVVGEKNKFLNYHQTSKCRVKAHWIIKNDDIEGKHYLVRLKETSNRLQKLIRHAVDKNERLHAYGRKWSFSDVARAENGWVLQTDRLNYILPLGKAYYEDQRTPREEYFLVQAGAKISDINKRIERDSIGRALATSGASNGQTIAGAIGTGTHGSAIDVGSMQNMVAGIQLLTGKKNLWLEHPDNPVLNEAFTKRIGAELVRDENLFEASLVSLGALGIVHSVLLHTEKRYLLESFRKKIPLDQIKRTMDTLDFRGVPIIGKKKRPYFFQVIVDPGATDGKAYVTTRYKKRAPKKYRPRYGLKEKYDLGDDLPGLVVRLLKVASPLRAPVVTALLKNKLKTLSGGKQNTGTPGETYDLTSGQKGAEGAAIALPVGYSALALKLALEAYKEQPWAPMIFAFRYVAQSRGLMAFTRYDPCCVLDLDGLHTRDGSTINLMEAIRQKFDDADIPYTQHWGKLNNISPARLKKGYAGKVNKWHRAREEILSNAEQRVFSNDFLENSGLS